MGKNKKVKHIENVLDFVYSNFDSFSLKDYQRAIVKVGAVIGGHIGDSMVELASHFIIEPSLLEGVEVPPEARPDFLMPPERFQYVKDEQKDWRRFLDWMIENFENGSWQIEFETECAFSWEDEETEPFEFTPSLSSKTKNAIAYLTYRKDMELDEEGRISDLSEKNRLIEEESQIKVKLPAGAIWFLQALDGYPKSSLKRCPVCEKIFFNSSKRMKTYCTLRCQNTAAARRSRLKKE